MKKIQLSNLFSSEFLKGDYELFSIFFHIIGFLLIATLGGYISERLNLTRKELGESKKNLIILQNLYENIYRV